jgi:hypothetical protein
MSPHATKWAGTSPLSVTFVAEYSRQDGANIAGEGAAFPILTQGGEYKLLFPSNEIRLDSNQTIPRATGTPSGYIFSPQGAQHVVYRGTDSGIHDVWWTPNGWFHSDASAAADGEPASSDPHGYPLDEQYLHCIAYVADKKLLELSWSQADSLGPDADEDVKAGWRIEPLYEATAADQKPVGRPFGGLFTPKRGVVYRVADRLWAAVQGVVPGTWDPLQLNAGVLPGAASDPTGVVVTETASGATTVLSRHLFYLGTDGNLHELRSDAAGAHWSHTDLTAATGSPKPAAGANPSAYAFRFGGQTTLHVVYRDQDGTVHELWGPVGSWNHNPIGAPYGKAEGDPTGYVTECYGAQHVVYRGKDNQIHELWWNVTGWYENVLTQAVSGAPSAGGDPVGYSFERQGTKHVVYRAQDGGLRELWWFPYAWHLGQYELAKPYLDPIGPLISPFFYEDQAAPHTFFVEPSLAEKTVHDWEEYVVTTEEYVQDKIPIPVEISPWFPEKIKVQPSEFGLHATGSRVRDYLLDDNVLLETRKGMFSATGGVRVDTMPAVSQSVAAQPIQVIDAARGAALNLGKLTTNVAVRRGGV